MSILNNFQLFNSFFFTLEVVFFLAYMLASFIVSKRGRIKFGVENFLLVESVALILFVFPLISPILALFNSSFWWFMGITFVLNVLLILRAGKMSDVIAPGNPGSIAIMLPILLTIFTYPVVAILYMIFGGFG